MTLRSIVTEWLPYIFKYGILVQAVTSMRLKSFLNILVQMITITWQCNASNTHTCAATIYKICIPLLTLEQFVWIITPKLLEVTFSVLIKGVNWRKHYSTVGCTELLPSFVYHDVWFGANQHNCQILTFKQFFFGEKLCSRNMQTGKSVILPLFC